MKQWHTGELLPGVKRTTDQAIAKSITRYCQTLYHPIGTCAMGTASDTVVDPDLRVRGTGGLWVADASILPQMPRGNPNATVMTVAKFCQSKIDNHV